MKKLNTRQNMSFIVFTIVIFVALTIGVWAQEAPKPVSEETITRGAMLQEYYITTASGKAKVYVAKINLQDPYIKIDAIYGKNGKLGKNQTVQKMAEESGAIAAINGDFFDMTSGSTLGPLLKDDRWLTTPSGIDGLSGFGITKDLQPVIEPFTFQGSVIAMNGQAFLIAAINKTISLVDKLSIFDSNWDLSNWPVKALGAYTCVVVEDDVVTEILDTCPPKKIPEDGYVILGNGVGAQFLQTNIHTGEEIYLNYQINPSDNWSFVLGAHTPLVKNGVRAKFTRNITGYHARTAVGYSKDKKYVYWITVENSKNSSGMTLEELADFMIKIGVNQGVNLDGGGSTTLVTRHPGESSLAVVTVPEQGSLRSVPDGLGLYSTAPQGKLKDFFVGAPSFVLINEDIFLSLKAIDEYDNPLSTGNKSVSWKAKNDNALLDGNQLTGVKPGRAVVEIKSDQTTKEFTVDIVGRDQISRLNFGISSLLLNPGETATINPTVTIKGGQTRQVAANLFRWEWIGVKGSVSEKGEIKAGSIPGAGWLVGTYDGFSSVIPVHIGTENQILLDFENKPEISFLGSPQEVTGTFKLSQSEKKQGNYSGELTYNFSQSTADVQAAYGQFGTKGVSFSGVARGIDLWVNGDNSNYWLRAEILDQNGQIQYVTLADKINWSGWKELSVDFPLALEAPTLKRIYVVNLKNSGSGEPGQGKINCDQIAFKTWQSLPEEKNVTLKLFVNKKVMKVNGQEQKIDQGPIIEKGKSYIPARYMIEALGGKVFWNASDKQVRILLRENFIDLWVNDKEHTIVNGENRLSDTAPIIRNNRTLIPVRMVTENLGFKVDWVNGEITIQKK